MPETLILDYRRGGASELTLGEPLSPSSAEAILEATRARLTARMETSALELLDSLRFTVHEATNGFGDDFLALVALASPETIAEHRRRLAPPGSALKLAATALRTAADEVTDSETELRFLALTIGENVVRGGRGEYRFEEEFDRGGFATIHRATAEDGTVLALKRLHATDEESVARLRREIQEQSRIDHPAVMPIVDYDASLRWFVMPLAEESLAARFVSGPIDDALLRRVLVSVAEGLRAAHVLGLVHRDVAPRNILRLGSQWVVADWGVLRRPRGLTTLVRTQGELGSLGFAAPELFREAHDAGPAADVYALGRVAAWAATRAWPEQNVPLIPEGPWRQFVRRTTAHEPTARPQAMDDVLSLLQRVPGPDVVGADERSMLDLARDLHRRLPEREAGRELLTLGLAHVESTELFVEHVYAVQRPALDDWARDRSDDLATLALAMEGHLRDREYWRGRQFDDANARIAWLRLAAQLASTHGRHGLLEDASLALFRAEVRWRRFAQRRSTRSWLESLRGVAAETVARALGETPGAVEWFADEGWSASQTAASIRAHFDALRDA